MRPPRPVAFGLRGEASCRSRNAVDSVIVLAFRAGRFGYEIDLGLPGAAIMLAVVFSGRGRQPRPAAAAGVPGMSSRPSTRPHDAPHAAVLYGDLPAQNRMSWWGRAIRPGSNSPLSSSSNAAMASRTEVSQNALCALR